MVQGKEINVHPAGEPAAPVKPGAGTDIVLKVVFNALEKGEMQPMEFDPATKASEVINIPGGY